MIVWLFPSAVTLLGSAIGIHTFGALFEPIPLPLIPVPADRGILLKDVLDNAVAMREKAHAVIASAGRTTEREFFVKNQGNMVAEPVRGIENDTKSRTLTANYWKTNARDAFVDCAGGRTMAAEPICVAERGRMYRGQPQHYEARTDGKTNTLTSVEKYNRLDEPVRCMQYELKEVYARDSGCVAWLAMPKCHDVLTRIYGWNGKCPTLTAHGGGNTEPKVFDCYSVCFNYSIEFDDDGRPIKAIGKDGKEITIYEVRDGKITSKGKQYPIKLKDGFYIIRKLTVSECKR